LPNDKSDECLKDSTIRVIERECGVETRYDLEIIGRLKKTFAIFTILNIVNTIEALVTSGFRDDHLPLYHRDDSASLSGLVSTIPIIEIILNGFPPGDRWGFGKGYIDIHLFA